MKKFNHYKTTKGRVLVAWLIFLGASVIGASGASIYYTVKAYKTNSKMFSEGYKEAVKDQIRK